ncbi:hypothetical protein [Vibrio sp.]
MLSLFEPIQTWFVYTQVTSGASFSKNKTSFMLRQIGLKGAYIPSPIFLA